MSGVPPTRMNQQIYKGKLKAAQGGHKLLKKKADALKVGLHTSFNIGFWRFTNSSGGSMILLAISWEDIVVVT